jgi:hypothetical protein
MTGGLPVKSEEGKSSVSEAILPACLFSKKGRTHVSFHVDFGKRYFYSRRSSLGNIEEVEL